MNDQSNFDIIYKTFRILFMNPDSDDVLEFTYVYDQIKSGRDIDNLEEEIETNKNDHGRAYPLGYKRK